MNQSRTILFRADGGREVGMGHLMRCRTLAMAMQTLGWEPHFFGSGIPEQGFLDMAGKPFSVREVAGGGGGNDTIDVAKALGASLIVVDHYGFRMENFLNLWKSGFRVLAIDDLGDRGMPVDAVLNPNPLFDEAPYVRQGIPIRMVGERFTLIRPEILACRQVQTPGVKTLLISLGGGDVQTLTMSILQEIPEELFDHVWVSVSPVCPIDELKKWEQKSHQCHHLNIDHSRFHEILATARLAITGGGTTLWEVYTLGIPSIAVVWAENQRHSIEVVERRQTSLLVDARKSIPHATIGPACRRLLDEVEGDRQVVAQHDLIDGGGATRAVEILHRLATGSP